MNHHKAPAVGIATMKSLAILKAQKTTFKALILKRQRF
jgi:hypothetical protein